MASVQASGGCGALLLAGALLAGHRLIAVGGAANVPVVAIALLHDVPRTADVVARTPTRLYALAKHDFGTAVTGHPGPRRETERIAGARLANIASLDVTALAAERVVREIMTGIALRRRAS